MGKGDVLPMRCELIRSIEERSHKMRLTVRLLGPLVLLLGHVTAAPAQTFTVFDAPNALLMVSSSINAQGDVTGYFNDGRGDAALCGMRRVISPFSMPPVALWLS